MTTTDNNLRLSERTIALQGRTSLPGKVARIAFGALGLVAMVAASGAAYEAIASAGDDTAYPRAGRLVDVGGYKLHLDCRGEGSPTVVMDAGLGGSSLDWTLVQPELARTTRVCTYDRAGMGRSEPGPEPRSPAHLADELRVLLQGAGVPGPYVLIGHSLAGKNIRMLASTHPEEVAGMVLVDARSEIVEVNSDMMAFETALEAQAALYTVARRLGIARLFGAMLVDLPELPPSLATEMALAQTKADAIAETTLEGKSRTADDKALASTSLGSLPLVVIAASESMRDLPDWPAAQKSMAALSTNSRLVVAESSGHAVHLTEPGAVIDAALSVIAEARQNH